MKGKIIGVIVCLFLFLPSCDKASNYGESLTLSKSPYTGTNLRLEGYYYQIDKDGKGQIVYQIYFLHENGVMLGEAWVNLSDLPEREKEFANGVYYDFVKNDITEWGVFIVEGAKIKFEKWYPSSGGPAPVFIHSGDILNDTTFHINLSVASHNLKNARSLDNTFHFKKFSPKPSNSNKFTH